MSSFKCYNIQRVSPFALWSTIRTKQCPPGSSEETGMKWLAFKTLSAGIGRTSLWCRLSRLTSTHYSMTLLSAFFFLRCLKLLLCMLVHDLERPMHKRKTTVWSRFFLSTIMGIELRLLVSTSSAVPGDIITWGPRGTHFNMPQQKATSDKMCLKNALKFSHWY